MKTYTVVDGKVEPGISVVETPYPHVTLGEGGNKRATWIPLGKQDASNMVEDGKIAEVGVIALKDKETHQPTGKYLLVSPREGHDNRVVVLWSVSSGYRGNAEIKADEDVVVIGYDHAWHSGRGNLGENAEILVILKPGQKLFTAYTGRRIQEGLGQLKWNGEKIVVEFGDSAYFASLEEEVQGDLI